ncbi:MAG: hypothetical protein KDC98_05115 [Planctomycetes bacterium]|nr:hypothetical protein [Planctomycetota bacterium]
MPAAPEFGDADRDLQQLRARLRCQLIGMFSHLAELARELEQRHSEAVRDRLSGSDAIGRDPVSCEMQDEHDELAMQIAHVRLALAGVEEEIGDRRCLSFATEAAARPGLAVA